MGKALIYSLSCPYSKKIKYIGKTVKSLRERLNGHNIYSDAKVSKWVKKLYVQKRKPIIEIVDVVNKSELNYWERYWIHQFSAWGFNLLNIVHTLSSKANIKFRKTKKDRIPSLRIKNPSKELYDYVANLAANGKRSIPKQFELIIEEYAKLTHPALYQDIKDKVERGETSKLLKNL